MEAIALNITYIVERGVEGSHLLFHTDEIRHAFRDAQQREEALRRGNSDEAHALVKTLTALPSLDAQRNLIDTLPDEQRDLLICLYFEFLDQYVAKHGRVVQ